MISWIRVLEEGVGDRSRKQLFFRIGIGAVESSLLVRQQANIPLDKQILSGPGPIDYTSLCIRCFLKLLGRLIGLGSFSNVVTFCTSPYKYLESPITHNQQRHDNNDHLDTK